MSFDVASAATFPGGPYDVVAIFDALHDMPDPVGAFYGASTLICVAHSMTADPKTALRAQAGQARLTEILDEAGFSRVRRATETPFIVLEARP